MAVTLTAPARHTRPFAAAAEATWPVLGVVVVVVEMKSTFASVSGVPDMATNVPVVVIALPLIVQAPFLKATAPVAAVNAAVLKLSVTGAVDASASIGALSAEPTG